MFMKGEGKCVHTGSEEMRSYRERGNAFILGVHIRSG